MKFMCFGYFDETAWAQMSAEEQESFIETCFRYDDELRRGGHFANGFALKPISESITVRPRNGQAVAVDGPYAETKEQVGGVLCLEARDLNHAVSLMLKHPGVKAGGFEIRPLDEEFMKRIEGRRTEE